MVLTVERTRTTILLGAVTLVAGDRFGSSPGVVAGMDYGRIA